jgi:hypothetical protein
MRVLSKHLNLLNEHTMTGVKLRTSVSEAKALMSGDEDYLRAMVQTIVQATLEAEMVRRCAGSSARKARSPRR